VSGVTSDVDNFRFARHSTGILACAVEKLHSSQNSGNLRDGNRNLFAEFGGLYGVVMSGSALS
jgi:hypothetical protein